MKIKVFLKQIIIVFSLGIFSPLILAQEGDSERTLALDYSGSDCISIRLIRDYTALDDSNLLIWASAKRPYFVRLAHRPMGLRSAFQIGTVSRDDRLCPYGGDALVFDAAGRETVRIASIKRITPDEADWLLVRFGKKEPPEQQAPEPGPVEGAEVEELD